MWKNRGLCERKSEDDRKNFEDVKEILRHSNGINYEELMEESRKKKDSIR